MADHPRIEELRRRVEKDPASIAFAQLAEEYRRSGDFEESARVCRTGLERHPSYLSARVTLGRALIELERYDEAQTELEFVLRSAPENLAAIRGLAEIHQRRGDLDQALKQYQTALGIARHDPDLEESVHDLSKQLGGSPPAPPAPEVQPPPIPFEFPEPIVTPPPELETFGTVTRVDVPAPTPAPEPAPVPLSPELEAAADEFTKALKALDALSLNLPMTPLPEAFELPALKEPEAEPPPAAPEPEVVEAVSNVEPGADLPLSPSVAPAEAGIVNELESWLDAIVLDRERGTAGRS